MGQRLRHASYIMHVSSVAVYVGWVMKMRDEFSFARELGGIGDTELFANKMGGEPARIRWVASVVMNKWSWAFADMFADKSCFSSHDIKACSRFD